jgi:hypothetical protein
MKKFVVGLLPLLVSLVGIASAAMTVEYVDTQPVCNPSESKTIEVYMT